MTKFSLVDRFPDFPPPPPPHPPRARRLRCDIEDVNWKRSSVTDHYISFFTELCGYVRSLLGVEGAIFNVIPIAKLVEMPEESLNRLTKSQKDENEQLEIVLQHWLKRNNVVEGLAALRKNLESLKQEG